MMHLTVRCTQARARTKGQTPVSQVAVVQVQIYEGGELLQTGDACICETNIGKIQLCQFLQPHQICQACEHKE